MANREQQPSISEQTGVGDTDADYPATQGNAGFAAPPLPFTRLGHYEVRSHLGRGGMGDVYLAYERELDREVAVKVLPEGFAQQPEFVRRFHVEATAAAKLVHTNIIPIYFIGEDNGAHFFAMQYVDGESLAARLSRESKLGVPDCLAIAEQLLEGLSAAHQKGMVHRDVKPGNVLLERDTQRAILVDFGLVKTRELHRNSSHTATGTIVGTVDYIAPEQAQGKNIDGRTDLYSFGAMLYRMLSGELPFKADNPTALIFQHVFEPAPKLDRDGGVPADVSRFVARLLEKRPEDRYQDASTALRDVRALQCGHPLGATVERPTTMIVAPAWTEPDDIDVPIETPVRGFLQRLKDRAQVAFSHRTPAWVQRLQTTEQQVDGAVAEYKRRRDELATPLKEAEDVVAELERQRDAWKVAAHESNDRAKREASDDAARDALQQKLAAQRQVDELQQQIDEQMQHIEVMRLRVRQVSATLERLHSQRDVLNARLKAAQAQLKISGVQPVAKRRATRLVAAIATVILASVVGLAMITQRMSPGARSRELQRLHDEQIPSDSPAFWRPYGFGNSGESVKDQGGHRIGLPGLVHSARFEPVDSPRHFATTDSQGRLNVYDLNENDSFDWFHGLNAGYGDALAFSPRNGEIATGPGTFVRVHRRNEPVKTLEGHTGRIVYLQFSGDGWTLFSVATDNTLRLWDLRTQTEVQRLNTPSGWDHKPVNWDEAGGQMAYGTLESDGRGVALFDLKTGTSTPIGKAKDNSGGASPNRGGYSVFLSPDSRYVIWCQLGIYTFDRRTKGRRVDFGRGTKDMSYSARTNRLLSADDTNTVRLWDARTGKVLDSYTLHTRKVTAVAISPDGKLGLSAGEDAFLFVWRLR